MKLKPYYCALLALVLAALSLPASAYTAYKTFSFPSDQTGQTVTYVIKNSAGTTITSGVSGAVIEIGGGSYGAAITVPDGTGYFVYASETNAGVTYTATDTLAPLVLLSAPDIASVASYAYSPSTATGTGGGSNILALTVTRNSSSIPVLSWTADSAATSYKVMRSVDGHAFTQIAAPAAGTTTYTDSTASTSTSYYYHVVSVH